MVKICLNNKGVIWFFFSLPVWILKSQSHLISSPFSSSHGHPLPRSLILIRPVHVQTFLHNCSLIPPLPQVWVSPQVSFIYLLPLPATLFPLSPVYNSPSIHTSLARKLLSFLFSSSSSCSLLPYLSFLSFVFVILPFMQASPINLFSSFPPIRFLILPFCSSPSFPPPAYCGR